MASGRDSSAAAPFSHKPNTSPHIYGGAGVHVGDLSRELAKTMPVEVRCCGDQHDAPDLFRAHGMHAREADERQ